MIHTNTYAGFVLQHLPSEQQSCTLLLNSTYKQLLSSYADDVYNQGCINLATPLNGGLQLLYSSIDGRMLVMHAGGY